MKFSIDLPVEHCVCERMSVRARGWIAPENSSGKTFARVRIVCDGGVVACCEPLTRRSDVARVHALDQSVGTGFDLFFALPGAEPRATATLKFFADRQDGSTVCFGSRTIRLSQHDYRKGLFPEFLDPQVVSPRERHHLYRSGPPASEPSAECLGLILERLNHAVHRRLVDVGCGVGAYARPLLAEGFDWTGCEVDPGLCATLAQARLPHVLVDGATLPFGDASFDAALCIEVLEHCDSPDAFVGEVRRIAPQALFSVPNAELIPYLAAQLVTPWHMLEPDHRNFFSRWSLHHLLQRHYRQVDVIAYGCTPLRSKDGSDLYYHLLAHGRS